MWINGVKSIKQFCKKMLQGRNKCGKIILQKHTNRVKFLQTGLNLDKVHIIVTKFCDLFC